MIILPLWQLALSIIGMGLFGWCLGWVIGYFSTKRKLK